VTRADTLSRPSLFTVSRGYKGPTMYDKVFISYANLPLLSQSPESLMGFIDIVNQIFPSSEKSRTHITKRVLATLRLTIAEKVDQFRDYLKKNNPEKYKDTFLRAAIETSIESLFTHRNGYCENNCQYRPERAEVLGKEIFKGTERINCFDCDLLYFKWLIGHLATGEHEGCYAHLNDFLHEGRSRMQSLIFMTEQPKTKDLRGVKVENIRFSYPLIGAVDYMRRSPFRRHITEMVSFCLSDFILSNEGKGANKIHMCQSCEVYFTGKRLNQRKYCNSCSQKNKMTKEQRREYQVKYRQRGKIDERESVIQSYIDLLNISRAEAVQLMEDEKAM
jgi:hypothetical protein